MISKLLLTGWGAALLVIPIASHPADTLLIASHVPAASAGSPAPMSPLPAQASPSAPVQRLRQAQYLRGYCQLTPPPPATPGVPVMLPVLLDDTATQGCRTVRWMRLTLPVAAGQDRRLAIFLTHVLPNDAVYLNGSYLGASEGFDDASSRTWNYPQYLPLPDSLLRPAGNELLIESIPRASDLSELSPVWIGPGDALFARYQRQQWLQVTGIELVSVLVGVIGLFTFLLWLRSRRERMFGLFALSCGIWLVRNAQFYVVHEYSVFYFSLLTDAALFWLVAVLFSLCLRVLERSMPNLERAAYLYALAFTVAMFLGGPLNKAPITTLGYALLLPPGLLFQIYLTRETWRAPTVLRALLWLAAVVTTASGAYDLALMENGLPWRVGYIMPYSAVLYALMVGWALLDRFVTHHRQFEQLNIELEGRVQRREQQLAAHYARAAQLEREQAVAGERDRILRNMHDGLGLHLIAALRLLDKGEHAQQPSLRQQLASLLSDAMDELRIAIDSMKPSGQDLLVMLGNLRYRLEPRLSSAGITLHWNIATLSDTVILGAAEVAEITRIAQELCTNAIKHSRASDMYLAVERTTPEQLRITILDNGIGYDTAATSPGEGLRSIRRRAEAIGAALEVRSGPGHTQIMLTLALGPGPAPAPAPSAAAGGGATARAGAAAELL